MRGYWAAAYFEGDVRMSGRFLGAIAGRAVVAFALAGFLSASASALETPADEKTKLKACEKQICSIILKKKTSGGDLSCDIGRTWQKSKIVKGVKEKNISWSFGDARCSVKVNMPRQGIIDALTKPAYDLQLAKHKIHCDVERTDTVSKIDLEMAPKMSFKDGKVTKAWLNVSNIEAPAIIKGALWTVATLEENVGLFHGEMISEVNEFIHQKCAKRHGG